MPLRGKNKQVQLVSITPKGTLYGTYDQPSGLAATRSQSLDELSSTTDNANKKHSGRQNLGDVARGISVDNSARSKTPPPRAESSGSPSRHPPSPRLNIQIVPLMEPRRSPNSDARQRKLTPPPPDPPTVSVPERRHHSTSDPPFSAPKQTTPAVKVAKQRRPTPTDSNTSDHKPTPSRGERSQSPSPIPNIQIISMMEPRRTNLPTGTSQSPNHAHIPLAKTKSAPQPVETRSRIKSSPAAVQVQIKHESKTKIDIHSGLGPPPSGLSITFDDYK